MLYDVSTLRLSSLSLPSSLLSIILRTVPCVFPLFSSLSSWRSRFGRYGSGRAMLSEEDICCVARGVSLDPIRERDIRKVVRRGDLGAGRSSMMERQKQSDVCIVRMDCDFSSGFGHHTHSLVEFSYPPSSCCVFNFQFLLHWLVWILIVRFRPVTYPVYPRTQCNRPVHPPPTIRSYAPRIPPQHSNPSRTSSGRFPTVRFLMFYITSFVSFRFASTVSSDLG